MMKVSRKVKELRASLDWERLELSWLKISWFSTNFTLLLLFSPSCYFLVNCTLLSSTFLLFSFIQTSYIEENGRVVDKMNKQKHKRKFPLLKTGQTDPIQTSVGSSPICLHKLSPKKNKKKKKRSFLVKFNIKSSYVVVVLN